MYARGHVGVGLLLYAPLATVLIMGNLFALAAVGWALTVFLSTLPDIDMKLPGVPHRGPTHTLWFAAAVGVVMAVLSGIGASVLIGQGAFDAALWSRVGIDGTQSAIGLGYMTGNDPLLAGGVTALFIGTISAMAIVSHLVGDVLTPMGIRPLTPFSNRKYTLKWTTAANNTANELLHYVGQFAMIGAIFVGSPTAREALLSFVR